MEIRKSEQWIFTDVAVPSIFFEVYVPILSGTATKVYLYALWLQQKGQRVTEKAFYEHLGLSEDELRTSIIELVSHELLERSDTAGVFELKDLKADELRRLLEREATAELAEVGTSENAETQERDQLLRSISQTYFSGTMSNAWFRLLERCMTDYHFEPAVVYAMIEDGRRRHKLQGPGYVKAIAESWHEAGIQSESDLNRYQQAREDLWSLSKQVGRYLNIHMTREHEHYLQHWTEDFGFDWPVIEKALSTVVKIGRPNFNYFDAILRNWHEAGLQTVEEIEAYDAQAFAEKNKQAAKPGQGQAGHAQGKPQGRRIAYERDYSQDDIMDLFTPIRPAEDSADAEHKDAEHKDTEDENAKNERLKQRFSKDEGATNPKTEDTFSVQNLDVDADLNQYPTPQKHAINRKKNKASNTSKPLANDPETEEPHGN